MGEVAVGPQSSAIIRALIGNTIDVKFANISNAGR